MTPEQHLAEEQAKLDAWIAANPGKPTPAELVLAVQHFRQEVAKAAK